MGGCRSGRRLRPNLARVVHRLLMAQRESVLTARVSASLQGPPYRKRWGELITIFNKQEKNLNVYFYM